MDKRKIDIDNDCPACSNGDCTGLIPAGLSSDEQLEAYKELYNFIPKAVSDNKKPHQN